MRILIAANAYPPNFVGGAELVAHTEAKALIALGHEVEVFAGEVRGFGRRHEVRRERWEGVPVTRVSMTPEDYDPDYVIFSKPGVEKEFRKLLRRFRPEVFHGHNLMGLSVALPYYAKEFGARAVVTLHDHWGFCFKNTLLRNDSSICQDFSQCAGCKSEISDGDGRNIPIRFRNDFIRLMLTFVDGFIAPSRYLADVYIRAGFPAEKIHVLPNGTDLGRFAKVQKVPRDGYLRLTYVGVLYPHKGLETLIRSLQYLPENAKIRLNIVGDGGLRQHLTSIAEEIRRADWVHFWGQVDSSSIERVYAETDVHVLPSIWPENQPVSICEAMACSIPSVVADVGGCSELVEDGVTGDLFPAGDSKRLAAKLQKYLDDPERADEAGAQAAKKISDTSVDDYVERLLESLFAPARDGLAATIGRGRGKVCAFDSNRVGPVGFAVALDPCTRSAWCFVMREWLPRSLKHEPAVIWLRKGENALWRLLAPFARLTPVVVEWPGATESLTKIKSLGNLRIIKRLQFAKDFLGGIS